MQDTDGAFQLFNELWAPRPLGSKHKHLSTDHVRDGWMGNLETTPTLSQNLDNQEEVRSALPVAYRLVLFVSDVPVLFLVFCCCWWPFRSF